MHLTGELNSSHPMSFPKLAAALIDQLVQAAAAANRENKSKRENTSMQSMMCVRLFIENEHDTQQLTTTRRWSPLCGWIVNAVAGAFSKKSPYIKNLLIIIIIYYLVPSGAHCYDYLYLPTCVYLMLSSLITLSGGNRELWQAVEFFKINKIIFIFFIIFLF